MWENFPPLDPWLENGKIAALPSEISKTRKDLILRMIIDTFSK